MLKKVTAYDVFGVPLSKLDFFPRSYHSHALHDI